MSYFAKIENGITVDVVKADQSVIDTRDGIWVEYWKDTNGEPEKRYNTAFTGCKYDYSNDAFITKQPYQSWSLNDNFQWEAPVEKPEEVDGYILIWSEEDLVWVSIEKPTDDNEVLE